MKIVVTSGGFDPIHEGHIEYLCIAKNYFNGAFHICIVNSNKFLINKKGYYVHDINTRLKIIESIKYVDSAIECIDDDNTVCKTLEHIRKESPNDDIYFLKGGDRTIENIPEKEICDKLGIKIIDGIGVKKNSSSDIIKTLVAKHCIETNLNEQKDKMKCYELQDSNNTELTVDEIDYILSLMDKFPLGYFHLSTKLLALKDSLINKNK